MKIKETYLQMAKRYTDTEIWKKQRWFKKLSKDYKLVFFYIKDLCNHAGVWNIDVLSLCEDIGLDGLDLMDFIQKCNQDFDSLTGQPIEKIRFKLINNTSLWFTIFMRFQYEGKDFKVNSAVPAVKSAIEILRGYGILEEALSKGYLTIKEELDNPSKRVKDKDIDKDKEIEIILKEKRDIFLKMIQDVVDEKPGAFSQTILNAFYKHWTEPNRSKSKIKWEMEDTWDTGRRLAKWRDNDDKWYPAKKEPEVPSQQPFIIGQKHNAVG